MSGLAHRCHDRSGIGALLRGPVDRVAFALSDRYDDHDHIGVMDLIDQAIADPAQLDRVAVLAARQARGRDVRRIEAFGELLLELVAGLRVELAPLLQRGLEQPPSGGPDC